jgi:acid stress-induced BolA-like protein IbaG/YrbA
VSATPEELKNRIEAGIPGARAEVSGDGHHFNAIVSAAAFDGLSRIAQHRLVYDVFGSEVGDRIHALSIQTNTGNQGDP